MYALRERRQHVTQEDFELSVAKVSLLFSSLSYSSAACSFALVSLLQVLRKAGDANTSSNKLFN
jgi:26S proteasome regulatory subunit T6